MFVRCFMRKARRLAGLSILMAVDAVCLELVSAEFPGIREFCREMHYLHRRAAANNPRRIWEFREIRLLLAGNLMGPIREKSCRFSDSAASEILGPYSIPNARRFLRRDVSAQGRRSSGHSQLQDPAAIEGAFWAVPALKRYSKKRTMPMR
jgi:hypothetical protein